MNKTRFLKKMETEQASWQSLLGKISESQLVEPGVTGEWSIRDIVAHITAYERGLVEWLSGALRGEIIQFEILDDPNIDYRNRAILSEIEGKPINEIFREAEEAFQQLIKLVQAFSEADLLNPDRTEWFVKPRWNQKRPLWECIADDSYRHNKQHIPDIQAWLGEKGAR